jgi:hypothetical protein
MISTINLCNVFFLWLLIASSLFSYYSSGFEWLFLVFICIMLVVLIIWIAVAYWVYKDAKKRNENAVLWLVIVLVASWLGLLLWFVLRQPIGGRKTSSLRYCPNCGREILFDANFCSYCGKKFESYL